MGSVKYEKVPVFYDDDDSDSDEEDSYLHKTYVTNKVTGGGIEISLGGPSTNPASLKPKYDYSQPQIHQSEDPDYYPEIPRQPLINRQTGGGPTIDLGGGFQEGGGWFGDMAKKYAGKALNYAKDNQLLSKGLNYAANRYGNNEGRLGQAARLAGRVGNFANSRGYGFEGGAYQPLNNTYEGKRTYVPNAVSRLMQENGKAMKQLWADIKTTQAYIPGFRKVTANTPDGRQAIGYTRMAKRGSNRRGQEDRWSRFVQRIPNGTTADGRPKFRWEPTQLVASAIPDILEAENRMRANKQKVIFTNEDQLAAYIHSHPDAMRVLEMIEDQGNAYASLAARERKTPEAKQLRREIKRVGTKIMKEQPNEFARLAQTKASQRVPSLNPRGPRQYQPRDTAYDFGQTGPNPYAREDFSIRDSANARLRRVGPGGLPSVFDVRDTVM